MNLQSAGKNFGESFVRTPRSVTDLGLAPGAPVVATFKASAVHLIAADVWLDTVARPGV